MLTTPHERPPAAYADWKAPPDDGGILIWPAPQSILANAQNNHRNLQSAGALIQNIPLSELRRRLRRELKIDDAAMVIAGGHQTELYHPGVWAKDLLAAAAAAAFGGRAMHLAVDTDQPKHLTLHWPGGAVPITDDPTPTFAAWCGLLRSPSPAHLQSIVTRFSQLQWNFHPLVPDWLDLFPAAAPLSDALTVACDRLDRSLGVNVDRVTASALFDSQSYLTLVHHLLARAGEFSVRYNAALSNYRGQHKIRTAARPMPDLLAAADECEVPFWLDDLNAADRRRATVRRFEHHWTLTLPNGDRFAFDPASGADSAADRLRSFLASARLRLTPRALTLTLFFRLMVADQFIHGIGGGRYDQVTDELILSFFGMTPPRFCVTTATLLFPGAEGRKKILLPQMAVEGRRIKQGVLGEAKMSLVAQIAALPRRSSARSVLFDQMHERLERVALNNKLLLDWQSRFAAARKVAITDQPLWDRELFYAIQPAERLRELHEKFSGRFA